VHIRLSHVDDDALLWHIRGILYYTVLCSRDDPATSVDDDGWRRLPTVGGVL
jgi:hypothetical protein